MATHAPRPRTKQSPLTSGGGLPLGLLALVLLTTAVACVSVLAVTLRHDPKTSLDQLVPFGLYAASLPLVWVWLRLSGYRGDGVIPAAALLLTGLGIVMHFRMGTDAGTRPGAMAWLAYPLGLVGFLAVIGLLGKQRVAALNRIGWLCYLLAIGVLLAMEVWGRRYRGGVYMPGNLNPSEAVKPLLTLFLASFLARRTQAFSETQTGRPVPPLRDLLVLGALWSVPMVLILRLNDLGLLVLLNGVLIVMLFASTRRLGYLAWGALGMAVVGFAAATVSHHARLRLDVWRNPFADPTGTGWQILQALSAMYSGGLWGSGIGAGAPHTVPIVTSDFIYAAWAEELGLVGCSLLLAVYAILFARGWRASAAASTPFVTTVGAGLTAALAFQTILNVAGVTKAMPITGITLPFISHGGSSLVTCLIMAGLLAAVSDRR
ncbi:MAG: FtsW/RodA/SpoVE family cell cycle protein [Lentisphaerae bacterium]|nr:FtsW/RodA/SpoVE family cell cycle protein [Lentisphaerota bacterium]